MESNILACFPCCPSHPNTWETQRQGSAEFCAFSVPSSLWNPVSSVTHGHEKVWVWGLYPHQPASKRLIQGQILQSGIPYCTLPEQSVRSQGLRAQLETPLLLTPTGHKLGPHGLLLGLINVQGWFTELKHTLFTGLLTRLAQGMKTQRCTGQGDMGRGASLPY